MRHSPFRWLIMKFRFSTVSRHQFNMHKIYLSERIYWCVFHSLTFVCKRESMCQWENLGFHPCYNFNTILVYLRFGLEKASNTTFFPGVFHNEETLARVELQSTILMDLLSSHRGKTRTWKWRREVTKSFPSGKIEAAMDEIILCLFQPIFFMIRWDASWFKKFTTLHVLHIHNYN